MKEAHHPVDFSPYLDGERTDRRYDEVRAHVESCPACRAQLESWRNVDALFRSPDLAIEVPRWQWSRIEARLDEARPRPGWPASLFGRTPRYAWAAGASFLVIAFLTVGVLRYRHSAEQETLVAVARFDATEQLRLKSAANPFRSDQVSSGNPFTRFQSDRMENQGNPFARR